jgi:hypothetical protein
MCVLTCRVDERTRNGLSVLAAALTVKLGYRVTTSDVVRGYLRGIDSVLSISPKNQITLSDERAKHLADLMNRN